MAYSLDQLKKDTTANNWTGADVYVKAKQSGFTADQLDATGGWAPGTSQKWIDEHGLDGLGPKQAKPPGMLSSWYDDYMKTAPKAATYAPATAAVTNWNVDKDQTVEGRIGGLLKQDNPLMQQAATAGLQQANKRGLINSSLGVQAGQEALYKAALPIASQDASTYGRSAEFNAGASNQASMFNAGETNRAGEFNAGASNEMAMKGFDIGAGMLTEAQKMKWGTDERVESQKYETDRLNVQNTFTERMQTLQEGGMDRRQAEQLAMQEALTKMAESGVQNRFDAQQALNSSQFDFEQAAIDRRQILAHENELAKLGFAAKLDNDKVPTDFALTTANTTMNAVNAIMNNPELDEAAKRVAIENAIENGNATMGWAAKFYDTAFPPIPGLIWGDQAATGPTADSGTPAAAQADGRKYIPERAGDGTGAGSGADGGAGGGGSW